MLVIKDFSLSRAVFKSDDFEAYAIVDPYHEMEKRFGHDFGAVIALLERLPTFLNGDAHKACRRTLATLQAKASQIELRAAERWFTDFEKAVLGSDCRIDLLTDFASPLFRAIAEAYGQAAHLPDEAVNLAQDIPLLFSSYTPLGRRIELNQTLMRMVSVGGQGIYDHLALLALGVRPLTGSLALSLHHLFTEQRGLVLSAMCWPDTFRVSALQYVDRVARSPMEVSGKSIVRGERVRCMLAVEGWSEEERSANLFGGGAHLCLGQPLSQKLWDMTKAFFSRYDMLAEALELRFTMAHEPFNMPDACPVAFKKVSQ